MPVIAVTPEPLFRFQDEYVRRLKEEGFDVCYPSRPGIPDEGETLEVLKGAVAVIAGGERYSDTVLSRLPACTTNELLTRCAFSGRVPFLLSGPRNVSENSQRIRPSGSRTENVESPPVQPSGVVAA